MQIFRLGQMLASLLDHHGIKMLTTDEASKVDPTGAHMQA